MGMDIAVYDGMSGWVWWLLSRSAVVCIKQVKYLEMLLN